MKTGWELDYVRDMDVLTFNTLSAILTKLVYRDKCEEAWVRMIAAQGKKESMESLTRTWRSAIGDEQVTVADKAPVAGEGAAAFLKALKIDPSRGGRF